jgi:pyruvate kinase
MQAGSDGFPTVTEAIEISAARLADRIGAKAITTLTRSGLSARLLAKYRPRVPILAFAENPRVRSQLALTWGVFVIPWQEIPSMDHTVFDDLLRELKRLGLISTTDKIVATAGIPTSLKQGTTNTIVVKSLADSL